MTKKGSKVSAASAKRAIKKSVSKAKAKAAPRSRRARGEEPSAAGAPAEPATTTAGRRRWKDLSVEQLQALYAEKVGRSTHSEDRAYLTWKIREAEGGRVPVGPRKDRIVGPKVAVTILFGEGTLEAIDAAGQADGFPKRLAYLRDNLRRGLQMRGHADVAAMIPG